MSADPAFDNAAQLERLFSFPVRLLHQIEMTSMCNLRCRYCVHPKMPRAKQHMDRTTYEACLSWAARFVGEHGQDELNLAGIGESTMHPDFVEFVHMAREAVGYGIRLVITTNGVLFTDEVARAIAGARPAVYVSAHRPEVAKPAVDAAARHGMLAGVSFDPTVAAVDWAGQLDWAVTAPKGTQCMWVREGRVMAMSDGRLTACCFDGSGQGVIGSVFDDVSRLRTRPYGLCEACHMNLNIGGYAQRSRQR